MSEWRLPQRIAERYCLEIVGISGLFDVEPGARPAWLSDFPERFCVPGADFRPLVRELLETARAEGMMLVSLDTPVASSVQKYAQLTLSAHHITPDYELADGAFLNDKMLLMPVGDTLEFKGPLPEITIQEARTEGKKGDEVAVCSFLLPMPFGCWQSHYMNLKTPAQYTVPNIEIRCTNESIDCIASDGKASRTPDMERQLDSAVPKGRFDALRHRDYDRSGADRRSNGTASPSSAVKKAKF